jgi:hypothetical protein
MKFLVPKKGEISLFSKRLPSCQKVLSTLYTNMKGTENLDHSNKLNPQSSETVLLFKPIHVETAENLYAGKRVS